MKLGRQRASGRRDTDTKRANAAELDALTRSEPNWREPQQELRAPIMFPASYGKEAGVWESFHNQAATGNSRFPRFGRSPEVWSLRCL